MHGPLNIKCVCNLTYPARNAHAPYYHAWPVWLYNAFPHYLLNETIFENALLYIKCVFSFSPRFSETFLVLRRIERDIIKNVHWSSCKVPLVLMKLEFSCQVFKETQVSNFMKIRPEG